MVRPCKWGCPVNAADDTAGYAAGKKLFNFAAGWQISDSALKSSVLTHMGVDIMRVERGNRLLNV